MSLPRSICTRKLVRKSPFLSQGETGHSFAWLGWSQTLAPRSQGNTQALRFFSSTICPKPLLRNANHTSLKASLQAQAKRFYAKGQRPYKFPIRTVAQDFEAQDQQQKQPQKPRRVLKAGVPLVGGIIVSCIALFLWESLEESKYRTQKTRKSRDNLEMYIRNFILSQRNIHEGRYWTLVTSAFAHNSITHILFNMMALWSFGPSIVAFYGLPTFGLVYFGSAVAGSMAQLWWWKQNPSKISRSAAGASGGIFGLTGFMAMGMPFVGVGLMFIPLDIPIRIATAGMAGLSIVALKENWASQYGHAAHLGGLVFGALWWAVVVRKRGGPKMW